MDSDVEVFIFSDPPPEAPEAPEARLLKLLTESEQRKAALVQIQEEVATLKRKHAAELAERAAVILDLTNRHAAQMTAARRNAAALMIALKALAALVKVCQDVRDEEGWTWEDSALAKAMRDAAEVIGAYGFPF